MTAEVKYFEDSDILSLWTGKPAAEAEEIADGVIIDFDADGNVVGFTLENAGELLRPLLDPALRLSTFHSPSPSAPSDASARPS